MSNSPFPMLGIDLGTTFSAVAYVDSEGQPQVIRASGSVVTPSVVCFNGRDAWVGEKAIARKFTTPHDIYEFIKRDIGKPVESTRAFYDGVLDGADIAPYEIGGYKYGAAGLSAIILRYLKKQALRHFRSLELTSETDDTKIPLSAIITVPAYFGEKERQETRLAGHAAGLEVVGILNEPTAAALAFGLMRRDDQTILVFDLGGGTFDVTVLQMSRGEAKVLATRGDNTLGGRDFDELLQRHLLEAARQHTGVEVDESRGFEIQRLAMEAKHALSECGSFTVSFTHAGRDLDVALHRRPPEGVSFDTDLLPSDATASEAFYFEERSSTLLQHCRALCESVLEGVTIESPLGPRPARWNDIGEIVLAGGSCKMPMVADMLERLTRRRIRKSIEGFSYDTAIAVGAALYGTHRERVRDVLSHGLGVKLIRNGRPYVDFLMKKDSPIPQSTSRSYRAAERAILEVWEGESEEPDECTRRGVLELDNSAGTVTIFMRVDADGCLHVSADYPPVGSKEMEIRNDLFNFRGRAAELARRIQSLTINV
jgi:molecular chaperone DnaK